MLEWFGITFWKAVSFFHYPTIYLRFGGLQGSLLLPTGSVPTKGSFHFPPNSIEKPVDKATAALYALDGIGFRHVQFVRDLSFHDLFHDPQETEKIWHPNNMQEKTLSTVCGPGVYIVEAPMGMGKTEAALWAAYELLRGLP
jgi:hypothetical protein